MGRGGAGPPPPSFLFWDAGTPPGMGVGGVVGDPPSCAGRKKSDPIRPEWFRKCWPRRRFRTDLELDGSRNPDFWEGGVPDHPPLRFVLVRRHPPWQWGGGGGVGPPLLCGPEKSDPIRPERFRKCWPRRRFRTDLELDDSRNPDFWEGGGAGPPPHRFCFGTQAPPLAWGGGGWWRTPPLLQAENFTQDCLPSEILFRTGVRLIWIEPGPGILGRGGVSIPPWHEGGGVVGDPPSVVDGFFSKSENRICEDKVRCSYSMLSESRRRKKIAALNHPSAVTVQLSILQHQVIIQSVVIL